MTHDEDMRSELLKADGISRDAVSDADRAALNRILERDAARAQRMRWLAIVAWAVFVGVWLALGIARSADPKGAGTDYKLLIFYALAWIAVAFTVSYVVRRHNVWKTDLRTHVIGIEARLAALEEAVRKITPSR